MNFEENKSDEKCKKYFGEWAFFTNESQKKEAEIYLKFWKKNLLKKLNRDCYDVKLIDEKWGEIPAHLSGCLEQFSRIYLKIYIEADFHYELGKNI